MFVDIGHCDTQVTVAAFEQGEMKVLCHSSDQNLGGRDFDEVLFKHFAAHFNEKYKIDVYSNASAFVRLRISCEKVKKVLSANAEAPLSIECLIGDTDVRGIITRDEFENLSSKLLERVTVPCSMALKDSGLTVDELYTIELVGSGSPIPAITRKLTSFLKKEPTRTLNASESVESNSFSKWLKMSLRFVYVPSEPSGAEKGMFKIKVKLNDHGIVKIDSATASIAYYTNADVSTINDELHEAREKENMLAEQDIKGQRNALVFFIHDTRFKLSGTYQSFVTDTEKEEITNNLQQTENWLNEDSDDESEQDYTGTLKDLKFDCI
ncbi:putative Heat shock protein 70 family [Helianthus annuus]|nr:putative Heat shock protein 70 family [Helianthus annuus]